MGTPRSRAVVGIQCGPTTPGDGWANWNWRVAERGGHVAMEMMPYVEFVELADQAR